MEQMGVTNATDVFINGTWWCMVSGWTQGDQNGTKTMAELNSSMEYLVPCDSLEDANATYVHEEDDDMSVWLDSFWTILFSSMITAAIAGNSIVIWIVIAHKRMWNATNSFIVNLSIADLLNSIFNTIFSFIFMKSRNWVFGKEFCTLNHFFAYSTVSASSFTLSAISLDRHISILRPNKPHIASKTAAGLILAVWALSVLVALPPTFYTAHHSSGNATGDIINYCLLIWPDGPPTISYYDYQYNIFFSIVTYLIPVTQMLISYSHMSFVLWKKSIPFSGSTPTNAQHETQVTTRDIQLARSQEKAINNKRKLVKMFFTVVVLFGLCWFPYHFYFLYTFHDKSIISRPNIQHVYLTFYWLAMANSMINPIIYYLMNARFRYYFRTLVLNFRASVWHFFSTDYSDSFPMEYSPKFRPKFPPNQHQHPPHHHQGALYEAPRNNFKMEIFKQSTCGEPNPDRNAYSGTRSRSPNNPKTTSLMVYK
ncbi:tachykinin-like peptides receptor 86C [Tigriopus californicus]|uniref:tachykinin-like peptides receptor 86C n=1 Tax=Tigriopus californicus TaxID=6832 RepID=UPI0027DA0EEB|nr:tachykinin-like peptides receptor 86C [Tigriopus californicus]